MICAIEAKSWHEMAKLNTRQEKLGESLLTDDIKAKM